MKERKFDWKTDYYDKLNPSEKKKLHRNQKISMCIVATLILGSVALLIFG